MSKYISKLLHLACCVFLISSCNTEKVHSDLKSVIKINKELISKDRNTELPAINMNKVSLSSDSNFFIQDFSKLIVVKDTIIVIDKKMSRVLVFDKDGKAVKMIEHVGHGPNEYLELSDVSYHKGVLSILDVGSKAIYRYDLKDNFLNKIKLNPDFAGYTFEKNDLQYLFYRRNETFNAATRYNLITVNDNLNEILDSAALIPSRIANMSFGGKNTLTSYTDLIYALPPFDEFVYVSDKSGHISPMYRLDIAKEFLAENSEVWKNKTLNEYALFPKLVESESVWDFSNLLVNSKFVVFSFYIGPDPYVCIYSKKKNSNRIFKVPKVMSGQLVVKFLAVDGDNFYCTMLNGQLKTSQRLFGKEDVNNKSILIKFNLSEHSF